MNTASAIFSSIILVVFLVTFEEQPTPLDRIELLRLTGARENQRKRIKGRRTKSIQLMLQGNAP